MIRATSWKWSAAVMPGRYVPSCTTRWPAALTEGCAPTLVMSIMEFLTFPRSCTRFPDSRRTSICSATGTLEPARSALDDTAQVGAPWRRRCDHGVLVDLSPQVLDGRFE